MLIKTLNTAVNILQHMYLCKILNSYLEKKIKDKKNSSLQIGEDGSNHFKEVHLTEPSGEYRYRTGQKKNKQILGP